MQAFQDFQDRVSILCKDRLSDEYFRLTTEGDCRDVVRCDRAGIAGKIRLAKVKCPTGLAFDLERQTCDWRSKVFNCDTLSKPQIAKPNLYTIEPVCPDDQIQCGSGECVLRSLFCDKTPHCQDGSDENVCRGDEDPNKADVCDTSECFLPNCFCSADGTSAPGVETGVLEIASVPMMITLTFNGAVNTENIKLYDQLFNSERLNPNGCTAKGTFFVSHKFTNYSAVQVLLLTTLSFS